jgi:hypothetical protein
LHNRETQKVGEFVGVIDGCIWRRAAGKQHIWLLKINFAVVIKSHQANLVRTTFSIARCDNDSE